MEEKEELRTDTVSPVQKKKERKGARQPEAARGGN